MEAFGQRDEPAIIGFGEALDFQTKVGREVIERRARELTRALIEGLRRIDGVKVWTHDDPARVGGDRVVPAGSARRAQAVPEPCTSAIASSARPAAATIVRGCDSRRISTTCTPTSTAPWTPSRATCARACDRSHVVSGFRPDQCSVRLYPDPEPRIPATIAVRRGPVAARAAGIGRWPDPTGSSLRSRQAHRGRSDRSRGRPAARIRRPPAPRASARHAVG